MNYPAQQVIELSIDLLKPYPRNARTHSRKQIKQIAASIERFGFTNPVLVSDGGEIIAGHGRVEAARLLGRRTVPTLALSHLSEVERRAYVLADTSSRSMPAGTRRSSRSSCRRWSISSSTSRSPGSAWRRSTLRSTRPAKRAPMVRFRPRTQYRRSRENRLPAWVTSGSSDDIDCYAAIRAMQPGWTG
ncbi:ParB/Srx family N-terminal domain-containing protein [Tsuneonella troitsensis]|uniref:ParB/Srx family N-terminal domain-containing protein n=1 Tax=Tsuneonella troitsensis TaxID=292222 RepID=UPI001F3C8792|nr:ParB/Srx family N-terminal domain-containing protein [Tsuneonella troitsensis]